MEIHLFSNMQYIYAWCNFHCYFSLPECKHQKEWVNMFYVEFLLENPQDQKRSLKCYEHTIKMRGQSSFQNVTFFFKCFGICEDIPTSTHPCCLRPPRPAYLMKRTVVGQLPIWGCLSDFHKPGVTILQIQRMHSCTGNP